MSLTTDGLIIKVNNVREYDRAVSILTSTHGIINAFVYGARSLKNKNNAGTSLLAYSKLTLQKKHDTYTVTEASPENVFINLRGDIEKLTLAQHFCELAQNLAPVDDNAKDYLRLVLNSLHFLSDSKREPMLLKAVTELRMLALSGYTPDLIACRECAKFEDDKMFFDPINAEILCSECFQGGLHFIPIGNSTLAAMRHIIYSDFSSLYNFTLLGQSLELLSTVTERYLLSQIDHKFSALQFYKNL